MKKNVMFKKSGLAYMPITGGAWAILIVYAFIVVCLLFLVRAILPETTSGIAQIVIFLIFYLAALRFAKTRSE